MLITIKFGFGPASTVLLSVKLTSTTRVLNSERLVIIVIESFMITEYQSADLIELTKRRVSHCFLNEIANVLKSLAGKRRIPMPEIPFTWLVSEGRFARDIARNCDRAFLSAIVLETSIASCLDRLSKSDRYYRELVRRD